jgi:hypothetical protein
MNEIQTEYLTAQVTIFAVEKQQVLRIPSVFVALVTEQA